MFCWETDTVNQVYLAAIKFGGFTHFWVIIGGFSYIILFNLCPHAKSAKLNSTPNLVDLQYQGIYHYSLSYLLLWRFFDYSCVVACLVGWLVCWLFGLLVDWPYKNIVKVFLLMADFLWILIVPPEWVVSKGNVDHGYKVVQWSTTEWLSLCIDITTTHQTPQCDVIQPAGVLYQIQG